MGFEQRTFIRKKNLSNGKIGFIVRERDTGLSFFVIFYSNFLLEHCSLACSLVRRLL